MRTSRVILATLAFGLLTTVAAPAHAADTPDDRTPPRLSFADGQVSFWRPGAQAWAEAQVNTPLAPGDELYAGSPGNLELQIGSRAFVRGWANTQIGLANQEPGYLQFKVTTGSASFDLRTLESGTTVEVATPNAVLTIEHAGYYRVDVTGERTAIVTRRGGQATITPATGEAVVITPSEEVVIEGTSSPRVSSYVAPPRDDWDKWNYARSETHLDTMSARYVSPGTYGVSDLDRYGTWRAVPDYGSVWIPTAVPHGWAPYTTGSWTLDPLYGWTWVDTAPWGWAPYHHGRWVFVNSYWAWAPGPVVARPVYAPALVAFFGGPSLRVGISIGGPVLGWVALGWGEPLVPWWGRPGFIRTPSWGGWGGPRVVNNVVINNTTVVNVTNINVYRNSTVQNAVVVVNESRFGRGPITSARVTTVDVKSLQPTHTAPQIAATPASFVPTERRGVRPPEASLKRSVVVTRPPLAAPEPVGGIERKAGPPGAPASAPRIVSAPPRQEADAVPARPPLGQSKVERRSRDRAAPLSPPKPPERGQAATPPREPKAVTPARSTPSSPAAPGAPAAPATAPPAPARPPEKAGKPEKAEKAEKPEKPQVAAPSPSAPPAPAPARRPEPPQVASPSPSAPQSPAAPATAPPAPARQKEKPEKAEKPQVAAPSPSAPQAPVARATAPPPPARQPQEKEKAQDKEKPKVAAPPARPPLPGEPANRVSPYRTPKEAKDAKQKEGG